MSGWCLPRAEFGGETQCCVDHRELRGAEVRDGQCTDRVIDLRHPARADHDRCHNSAVEQPRQRHLGEGVAAGLGEPVERADLVQDVRRHIAGLQEVSRGRARVSGDAAAEVFIGEQPLCQRREGNAADSLGLQRIEQTILRSAVEQVYRA